MVTWEHISRFGREQDFAKVVEKRGHTGIELLCEFRKKSRNNFPPCRKMWSGKCYSANPLLHFKIARAQNELGATWMKDKDNGIFFSGQEWGFAHGSVSM